MADELRARIMRANRARDTKPELVLRRYLHAIGLRYRIADRRLPGTPDLVFPRFRTVLFVHGCYWHHHEGCRRATIPKTNTAFWVAKFSANRRRDRRNIALLLEAGWRVGLVWECSISGDEVTMQVEQFVRDGSPAVREWPAPSP